MMCKFMDEQVRGPFAVGGCSTEQSIDAAATVDVAIGQDLDEIVRH